MQRRHALYFKAEPFGKGTGLCPKTRQINSVIMCASIYFAWSSRVQASKSSKIAGEIRVITVIAFRRQAILTRQGWHPQPAAPEGAPAFLGERSPFQLRVSWSYQWRVSRDQPRKRPVMSDSLAGPHIFQVTLTCGMVVDLGDGGFEKIGQTESHRRPSIASSLPSTLTRRTSSSPWFGQVRYSSALITPPAQQTGVYCSSGTSWGSIVIS